MVRRICPFLLLVSLIFFVAACQQEPANTSPLPGTSSPGPSPAANPPSPASADSSKSAIGNAGFVNVVPGAMASCDPAVEASVKWDLHGTHPDVNTVDVYVDDGTNVRLFTGGGASGEAKTGYGRVQVSASFSRTRMAIQNSMKCA